MTVNPPPIFGRRVAATLIALAGFLVFSVGFIGYTRVQTRNGDVVRLDPTLDGLLAPGANVEKVAGNLQRSEGPLWVSGGHYTSPPQLRFSHKPSRKTYGWFPSMGRLRQVSICASIICVPRSSLLACGVSSLRGGGGGNTFTGGVGGESTGRG